MQIYLQTSLHQWRVTGRGDDGTAEPRAGGWDVPFEGLHLLPIALSLAIPNPDKPVQLPSVHQTGWGRILWNK